MLFQKNPINIKLFIWCLKCTKWEILFSRLSWEEICACSGSYAFFLVNHSRYGTIKALRQRFQNFSLQKDFVVFTPGWMWREDEVRTRQAKGNWMDQGAGGIPAFYSRVYSIDGHAVCCFDLNLSLFSTCSLQGRLHCSWCLMEINSFCISYLGPITVAQI